MLPKCPYVCLYIHYISIYEGINADQEAREAHLKLAGVRVLDGLSMHGSDI